MQRVMTALLLAILAAGCGKFNDESAHFVAYNVSGDRVIFYVNNGAGHELAPNGTTKFTETIPVATDRYDGYTRNSTVDKIVRVSVAVKNLRTGNLTPPRICDAGAKVITHLSYEVYSGYEDVRCQSTYPSQANSLEEEMRGKLRQEK